MTPSITLSPAADKFMRRIVRFSGHPAGAGFRLVVSPGGCSGLSAEFSAEPAPADGDLVLGFEGLTMFVPSGCAPLLDGVTIDFADSMVQSGLVFLNQKAGACGCSSTGTASASPPGVATVALSSITVKSRPTAVRP